MTAEILRIFGYVAGIGGLALGVFFLLFRKVIQKKIFPSLTKNQAYRIINRFLILVTIVALFGIAAWVITEIFPWANRNVPNRDLIKIVNMDTYLTREAYHYEYQREKKSNAHFIDRLIREDTELLKKVDTIIEIVGTDFDGKDRIINYNPNLIIVHRSAFETEKSPDTGDVRLIRFLSDMVGTNAKILIYSRQHDTDKNYAEDIEDRTGLHGRVFIHRFEPGNPFEDDNQVNIFKKMIKELINKIDSNL